MSNTQPPPHQRGKPRNLNHHKYKVTAGFEDPRMDTFIDVQRALKKWCDAQDRKDEQIYGKKTVGWFQQKRQGGMANG